MSKTADEFKEAMRNLSEPEAKTVAANIGIERLKSAVDDDVIGLHDQFVAPSYEVLVRKIYNAVTDNPSDEDFKIYLKTSGKEVLDYISNAPRDVIRALSGVVPIKNVNYLINNTLEIEHNPVNFRSEMLIFLQSMNLLFDLYRESQLTSSDIERKENRKLILLLADKLNKALAEQDVEDDITSKLKDYL